MEFQSGIQAAGGILLIAVAAASAPARGDGPAGLAGHLRGYLREGRQAELWALQEVLPGVPKSCVPTGLLLDIVTEEACAFVNANSPARPETQATDLENLQALHSLFLRMRIRSDALRAPPETFERAIARASGPDSIRAFPVVVVSISYDRVDWARAARWKAALDAPLPTLRKRFFCASVPAYGFSGEPVRFEFGPDYIISNDSLGIRSVVVSQGDFAFATPFPGRVTVPRFDSGRFLLCRFALASGDTLSSYLDVLPR